LLALAIGLALVYESFLLLQGYQVWRLPASGRAKAIEENYAAQIEQLEAFATGFESALEMRQMGQDIGHEVLFASPEILSADVLKENAAINNWLTVKFAAGTTMKQLCPKSPPLGGSRASYCTVDELPAVKYVSRFARSDGNSFQVAMVLDLTRIR
jgi:hypothetical protein